MIPKRSGNLQRVSISDIFKNYNRKLNSALFLPGRVDGISLCVEFMYNWFLNKFGGEDESFFKAINLDGMDPMQQMKMWNIKDWLKRSKPRLSIIPKPDVSFNRDFVDDDYNDIMSYINRAGGHENFFLDKKNGIQIGLITRLNKVDFTFKIQVGQKPQQLDLYDHILMSCRVGKTITLYTGVDFLVPSKLIQRLCKDLHFKTDEDGMPIDHTAFLDYMNTYSPLTFLYKARGVNRKFEFFLRIENVMVHIRDIELDIDDGESEGMLKSNYGLEMRCEVRMPSPKLFVLFSYDEFDSMVYRDNMREALIITDLVLTPIPSKNKNGWNILLDGIFESDKPDEILKISLYDMFQGDKERPLTNILESIKYCKERRISPEIFLDIKVFNTMKEVETYVNWETMTLYTRNPIHNPKSKVVVYTDNKFINNAMIIQRDYMKNRMDYKREP